MILFTFFSCVFVNCIWLSITCNNCLNSDLKLVIGMSFSSTFSSSSSSDVFIDFFIFFFFLLHTLFGCFCLCLFGYILCLLLRSPFWFNVLFLDWCGGMFRFETGDT
eukprot:302228_1